MKKIFLGMNDLFVVTVATNKRNVELLQLNFHKIRP